MTKEEIAAEFLELSPEQLLACIKRLDAHDDYLPLRKMLEAIEDKFGWFSVITIDAGDVIDDWHHCNTEEGEPELCMEDAKQACMEVSQWDWSTTSSDIRNAAYDKAVELHTARHADYYAARREEKI